MSEHISNDYGLVAYVVFRVLRQWGYDKVFVTAAAKRLRTVGTTEDANNFFNPKYTDELGPNSKATADIALVCVQPCKLVDDDNPDQAPLPFAAITDLFMVPELDLPIYSMHKRNALSPLAMVPSIRVFQYVLLNHQEDVSCKAVRDKLTRQERERLDEMLAVFSGDEPGASYVARAPREIQVKVERIIERFRKPFSQETRPNEQFFRFFQIAMERVKAMGDYDPSTNTIKIKKQIQ